MGWNSMQEQVHFFKYGGKEIPVTYDFENIQDRLQECNCVIDLFLDYLKEKNIVFTEEEKKLLIADESIATSYIEGYETWLIPYFLVQECKCKGLAERATISCYNSYLYSLEKYKGENINDIDSILDIWKKLVSYKRLFIKRIRKSGVRVGNRMVTTHVAPPAKYVKSLLGDMFDSLQRYSKKSEDKYGLITPILFHYLYTFIHPFLDGNGRSARMIEQIMIKNTNNFDFVIPFSDIILEDRKAYYKTFKSGQTFGDGPTDVLSINLDYFINYNLYIIERGIIKIANELKCDLIYDEEKLKRIEKYVGDFSIIDKKAVLKEFEKEEIALFLLSGVLCYMGENKISYWYNGVKGNRQTQSLFDMDLFNTDKCEWM